MTASGANGRKRRQDLHRFTNSVFECSLWYLIKINLSLIILSKDQVWLTLGMMGGGSKCPPIFICETIEKVIRLCSVLKKIVLTIHHFSRIYLSICNGHIKPPPQSKLSCITWKMAISSKLPLNKKRSTQCIILLLFLLFSQIKIGGHFRSPLSF